MCLEEIGVTHHAVELPPRTTARMTVRAYIAVPDPAIIEAHFLGTILGMGIYRPWASSLGSDQGWRCRRGLVDTIPVLLTRCAGWPFGQASKGLGDLRWSLGLLSGRGLRRVASLPSPIYVHSQPEQRAQQELMEKRVVYHLVPFPCRLNGGMLPVFRAHELSVG